MMKLEKLDTPDIYLEPLLKRYGSGIRRERIEPIYSAMSVEFTQLAEPMAVYDECSPVEVIEMSEWLQATAVAVVLVVCTLGARLDRRTKELVRDNLVAAVILQEIALAGVNAVARRIHGSIRNEAEARRLKAGPAYRPGVGRWPLKVQRTVFTYLPVEKIEVSLNQQLFMSPINSTSMIIPITDLASRGPKR